MYTNCIDTAAARTRTPGRTATSVTPGTTMPAFGVAAGLGVRKSAAAGDARSAAQGALSAWSPPV